MQPHSIYLHIPFCQHRCSYCDFNTYAGLENLIFAYAQALRHEIKYVAATLDAKLPVHTIFFGGGTPSLLSAEDLASILKTLHTSFDVFPDAEISLEANPGTLSAAYLTELRNLGINRLSLGMQSAHPDELKFLERIHDYLDVVEAVTWARQAGFDNLSLDLIFGLPEQQTQTWVDSLQRALALAPEHFSLYALTLEHGTPLGSWAARGLIPEPDPDRAADMYELAAKMLAQVGYTQYEISNWARKNEKGRMKDEQRMDIEAQSPIAIRQSLFECRHNLQYWRNQPYLGFGAGGHGFVNGMRTVNVLSPKSYIQRLSKLNFSTSSGQALQHSTDDFPRTPATIEANPIDRETEMRETMMMGLRLTREGVSKARFQTRFGLSMREQFAEPIQQLVEWELLCWENDTLRLTPRGRLLGNQVFMQFV